MKSKKATKRALLSSALSLVLCFSMLLGTTFAWFTDEASTGVNTIQSGTLDIELLDAEGKNSIEGESLKFVKMQEDGETDPADGVLWEPGATYYTQGFQIHNNGNLYLKFQMVVNGVTNGNAKLLEAIDFYVTSDVNDESTWTKLSDFTAKEFKLAPDYFYSNEVGALEGAEEGSTLYLVGHMKEEANNDYQGLTIEGVGITVYATQVEAEYDSFDNTYDDLAAVTVDSMDELLAAIENAENGATIYVEPGTYDLSSGPIEIKGKTVFIVGLGNVTINKNFGNSHIFNVANGGSLILDNLNLDGNGKGKNGIYVRWDSDVTLKNCTIKNTGGKDILIDEASDAAHGEETASYVHLINTDIEDVAMCASPATSVPEATQDTYVYFNYDRNSTVGSIEKQDLNLKPENIIINGVKDGGNAITLYVSNDAELAAALNSIQTENKYWNKNVIVSMAAGEYSADHVINQFPGWNGISGRNTGNNYQGGVTAGDPTTNITFVGETASTYSLRGAQSVPTVTFTGNVTVNGFADSMAGLTSATSVTTFQNIAFDAANSVEENGEDSIAMYVTAAANNVNFEGCVFTNATHVNLGGSSPNGIGNVSFTGCTFENGGCLSGYPQNVTVKDCVVDGADNGFINIQSGGDITVENCTINAGKYFIRTKSTGTVLTVKDSDITMYESEETQHLVYFRGTNESATFTDCTIADGWTTEGVDANSTLTIGSYTEENGVTYYNDALTGDVTLTKISESAPAKVEILEGVTKLGSKVLQGNTNVKEVVIPSTVKDFGGTPNAAGTGASGGMFYQSAVEKVVLPEGLTEIPVAAFNQAANLTSVNIPSSVTKIGINAFAGSGLTTLEISENVEEIGYGAFRDMDSLTTVTIEGDVYIPGYAFRDCSNLKDVYLNGNDVTFGSNMIFTVTSTNNENPNGITVHVKNAVIKERLEATGQFKGTIVCENTPNGDGVYDDGNGNTYAYASDSTDLSTAISGGAETVYLSTGNYTMPIGLTATSPVNLQGKTVTISGTKDTVVDMTKVDARDQFVTGATMVFDGVTLNFGKVNYMGLANTASLTYKNCQINGLQFLFGEKVTFENCDFNSNGAEHSVWTYGAKNVSFIDCDFTYGDRGINCYSDNDVTGGKQTVNFTNCTFATENTESAGAVEINSCYFSVGIEVNMEGCTAPAYGEMAYVSPWDGTNGAKTTINVK